MRKAKLILLVLILFGCTKQSEPELPDVIKPEISTMFIKNGCSKSFGDTYAIRNRIDNLRVNELVSLRFILNDEQNETAMEYSISDQSILNEFKQLLDTIKVDVNKDHIETLPDGQLFAFEVTVKDKEPIVFKGNDYGFCLTKNACALTEEKMVLLDFFKKHTDSGLPVLPIDLYEITVDMGTWAETPAAEFEDIYQEPMFTFGNEEYLSPTVYNTWYFENDPWLQALKMAFYINDEFTDYHDIQDWNKVVAGLAMQQIQNGYRRNNYGSDMNTYYGPQGDSVTINMDEDVLPVHSLQPDRFVTYSMIEKAGKVLFGQDFTMPVITEKHLADYPMFTVNHSPQLKLCDIHTPYEYFFATLETGWIFEEAVNGNQRTYDLLIYTGSIKSPDDGKNSHSFNELFYVYKNDLGEAYDNVIGNEEHFKQVRIVLEETDEGIRINSFKYLNKLVAPEEEPATDSDAASEEDSSPAADIDLDLESESSTMSDASTNTDVSTLTDASEEDAE